MESITFSTALFSKTDILITWTAEVLAGSANSIVKLVHTKGSTYPSQNENFTYYLPATYVTS